MALNNTRKRVLWLGLALLLAGCAPVGPDFVKPNPAAPPDWAEPLSQGLESTPNTLAQWWTVFDDPVLNGLVEAARKNNNNLQIAGLRVLEARAQLGIATGLQYPQSQFAAGDATFISPPENSGTTQNFGQYNLGASVSWEIDFWGKFRRAIESADAAYLASIAAYDQGVVLLTASVVKVYTLVRVTEEGLRIGHQNLKLQKRSYEIAAVLYRNGAESELDMQQAETLLLSTQATIPTLQASLNQARNALAVLLGQPPGPVKSVLAENHGIPTPPENITVGFPADMLRRRPDVRQTELLALAQNAQVGLAEADLYPSFSLSGYLGLAAGSPGSSSIGNLFSADALALSIGPSFVWPFLNYGRIKNNVRVQDARLQQALIAYRETALQADREANDAISAFIGSREQTTILAKTVTAAKRSNELSTIRYQEGFSDYQRVLDAQQSLFTQQQRYISALGDNVSNLVDIYQALGGGWEAGGDQPYVDPETLRIMQERTDWGEIINAADPGDTNDIGRSEIDRQSETYVDEEK